MADVKPVETVVEVFPKFVRDATYVVEVRETRIAVKTYLRGSPQGETIARATALPFGWYDVVAGNLVHRYRPAGIVDEVKRAQRIRRGQSADFVAVVKRVAKAVGGTVSKHQHFEDLNSEGWSGYIIRGGRAATAPLDKLQDKFLADSAAVFRFSDHRKPVIGVACVDRALDVVEDRLDHEVRDLLEREADAVVAELANRAIYLRLRRAPKQADKLARMLAATMDGYGEGAGPISSFRREIAERRVLLWFDA